MKKFGKIAAIFGGISLALVGGVMLSACDKNTTTEITKEEFETYLSDVDTQLNFDTGIHGVIQKASDEQVEFWIVQNEDNFEMRAVKSTLTDEIWTEVDTDYSTDGLIFDEKGNRKIYYDIAHYDFEDGIINSGFNANSMSQRIMAYTENATKIVESKTAEDRSFEIEIDEANANPIVIEFTNNKISKFEYSTMIEDVTQRKLLLESYEGTVELPQNLNDYNYGEVYNGQELAHAVKRNGEIVLKTSVRIKEPIVVNSTVLLDLNGKTVDMDNSMKFDLESKCLAMFDIQSGNLTITGEGAITSKNQVAIFNVGDKFSEVKKKGSLVIENGEFTNASLETKDISNDLDDTILQVQNGTALIKNGVFMLNIAVNADSETTEEEKMEMSRFMLNKYDASADDLENGVSASIKVSGGMFYYYDPAHSKSEYPEENFCEENCQSTSIDDTFVFEVTMNE